jgi:predicted ATPase
MPKSLMNPTQLFLTERVEALRIEIANDKIKLQEKELELQQAESARVAAFNGGANNDYNKSTTFKQKVLFCLNSKEMILSVNDMVAFLMEVDSDLAKDENNTAKSLRLAIRRLLRENVLEEYKSTKIKNIHYGLKSWNDERHDIIGNFLAS